MRDGVERADVERCQPGGGADDNLSLERRRSICAECGGSHVGQRRPRRSPSGSGSPGVWATSSKRYSNGWSLLASYSIDRRDERKNIPLNPNQARYNFELPQTHRGVRLSGTHDLPWNMLFSSTFTGQTGEYFNRVVQVRNALAHQGERDR